MFTFTRSRAHPGALAALLVALASSAARADDDPFWGRDKALHFAVAGTIAGTGYGVTTALTPDRWKALAIGGTLAVGAGALKEGLDAAGLGDPSWKDFAWDVIGAACGLGVAWAIDVGVHGGTVPPWSATSTAALRARSAAMTIRF
jgi:putative lipoprotein